MHELHGPKKKNSSRPGPSVCAGVRVLIRVDGGHCISPIVVVVVVVREGEREEGVGRKERGIEGGRGSINLRFQRGI